MRSGIEQLIILLLAAFALMLVITLASQPWLNSRINWTEKFTLAFAAVAAIGSFGAAIDGYLQWDIMGRQLTEATNQRLLTIAQIRANLRREDPLITPIGTNNQLIGAGEQIAGWQVSPQWTNSGSTKAIDFFGWFQIFPFRHLPPHKLTGGDCPALESPKELPFPAIVQPSKPFKQFAERLDVQDAVAAHDGKGYILMVGHIEYRDSLPETSPHF
jgi:hypothetical protein